LFCTAAIIFTLSPVPACTANADQQACDQASQTCTDQGGTPSDCQVTSSTCLASECQCTCTYQ
jgi:hypothetical protein